MDGAAHPGGALAASSLQAATELVLQAVLLDRRTELRPLYWRTAPTGPAASRPMLGSDGVLVVPAGTGISFDTYFGALFEYHWRLRTRLRSVVLRLALTGVAHVRVWRRVDQAADALLLERQVAGNTDLVLPAGPAHVRQAGLLWFEVAAADEPAVLHSACWLTPDSDGMAIGLGIVICTFNRERELSTVLGRIASCAALDQRLGRVTVVNQGRPGLADRQCMAEAAGRLGSRLRIIDQANFGGAGGFSRGLLESLDDDAVTHVCFLDDDIVLEPDCLARMAAFFALAHENLALGGHMLDAVQPTSLYEAGAVVLDNWALRPLHHEINLGNPHALTGLLNSSAMHYNGWWMFGFPKSVVERLGMPLSCFIRGDDVEFGLRLHRHGIATVPLPGVAIWHEPFYLKLGSWQLYYETRNALLCAALHQEFTPRRVAVQLAKRLLTQLLTYRYYSAALIVRAIEDFADGPGFLESDPRPLHASLATLLDVYAQDWTCRDTVLRPAPIGVSPRRRLGFLTAMAKALARNWFIAPRSQAAPLSIEAKDLVWFRIVASDSLAVDTYWDARFPTYHRDRANFRRLLVKGALAIWRVSRSAAALQQSLARRNPVLTSASFWRRYLGLELTRE